MNKLRMLSLCSGIGGADLAAEWTGAIEVVGQVEIDPFCIQVLERHWPHVRRMGDIKDVRGDEFGSIDLVAGGIPCQPFSSAGKQRGVADDRYLWPEMFRIVQRCNAAWVVIENVDDFTYMALDIVQADLESQDYTVQAIVLPACAVGAPHVRERCFVVAHSDRFRESGQEGCFPDGQRGTPLSASLRQWKDTACVDSRTGLADTSSPGWAECNVASLPSKPGHIARRTRAPGNVADAKYRRCERGREYEEPSGTTLLCGSSATWSEPQSRMGRMFDGISTRLDSMHWPALPGQEQEAWEPARTVSGRQPHRNKRLKALGNAIVPSQIFPIFQGIAVWEMGAEGDQDASLL